MRASRGRSSEAAYRTDLKAQPPNMMKSFKDLYRSLEGSSRSFFFFELLKREASVQAFQPDIVLSFYLAVEGQRTRTGTMNMWFSKRLNPVLYYPSV